MTNFLFTDLNKLPITIQLGDFAGEMLYWGFYPPEYWRNYLHIHSFFEICYGYQGRGVFYICGDDHAVEAGDLFVAKPGELHEIISSADDPLGIYFWSFALSLGGHADIAHESDAAHDARRDLNTLFAAFSESTRRISRQTEEISHTLHLLGAEITALQPGFHQKIVNLNTNLLIDVARTVVDPQIERAPLPAVKDDAAQKIVRYLQDNYERPIQVRDVAAQLHMSERHTSRIFRRAVGVSIQQYLTQLRIATAKQRLLDQSRPISEVAHSLGYRDARHFSTLFRKHTSLAPTEFRAQQGTQFLG